MTVLWNSKTPETGKNNQIFQPSNQIFWLRRLFLGSAVWGDFGGRWYTLTIFQQVGLK
jgi:hypothetical protein